MTSVMLLRRMVAGFVAAIRRARTLAMIIMMPTLMALSQTAQAVHVYQIGDLENSVWSEPREFNIGDKINVAMNWSSNTWGFKSCHFYSRPPGDRDAYGFDGINGHCNKSDYPDGRIPRSGYSVLNTGSVQSAGARTYEMVPGGTYEVTVEVYPWGGGVSDTSVRRFKLRHLSGGFTSIEADRYTKGKVNVKGAWKGNGANGDVKFWRRESSSSPWILAGQGNGNFSVTGLPPGQHTLYAYVEFNGKHEAQVKSQTVHVLGGSASSFAVEGRKVRVKGTVEGGADSVRLYDSDFSTLLGSCSATSNFDCVTNELPFGSHTIHAYAYRGDDQYLALESETVEIKPVAAWASSYTTDTVIKGTKLKIDIDTTQSAGATHAIVQTGLSNQSWSSDSTEIPIASGSFEVPDSDTWDYTQTHKMDIHFKVKSNGVWSSFSDKKQFSIIPAKPGWSESPVDINHEQALQIKSTTDAGEAEVHYCALGAACDTGDWPTKIIALSHGAGAVTGLESATYRIKFRVRGSSSATLWSAFSDEKAVRVNVTDAVFAQSILSVHRQSGSPALGAGAIVTAGEQLIYRLKVHVSHRVLGLQLSFGMPSALEKAGVPTFRAELSQPGSPIAGILYPVGQGSLNGEWSGGGSAFGAGTHLLDPLKTLLGLQRNKYIVIDIPVRVKDGAPSGPIAVRAQARGALSGNAVDIAAPTLLIRMPAADKVLSLTVATPDQKDDVPQIGAGQSMTYRLTLTALQPAEGVQLTYLLPAGLIKAGKLAFGPGSYLTAGLSLSWATNAGAASLLDGDIALPAGQKIVIDIPLRIHSQVQPGSFIASLFRAVARHADGEVRVTHKLSVTDPEARDSQLELIKSVDKTDAKPGDTLTYTIRFHNRAAEPLTGLVIYEQVPPYTQLISSSVRCNDDVPIELQCHAILPDADKRLAKSGTQANGEDAAKPMQWGFGGAIPSGQRGSVGFQVQVR